MAQKLQFTMSLFFPCAVSLAIVYLSAHPPSPSLLLHIPPSLPLPNFQISTFIPDEFSIAGLTHKFLLYLQILWIAAPHFFLPTITILHNLASGLPKYYWAFWSCYSLPISVLFSGLSMPNIPKHADILCKYIRLLRALKRLWPIFTS